MKLLNFLLLNFLPLLTTALTPWESIHQTLHTYPLAIDSKDFALLTQVFTPTATANYTGPLSNLTGLPAIQAGLSASVAKLFSQHLLGTTVIDLDLAGKKANSTTYFQATLFGNPYSLGSVVTLFGYYADDLVEVKMGAGWEWLIEKRTLVFQGPGFVGNLTLVGQ
jgi:hypothetical protein